MRNPETAKIEASVYDSGMTLAPLPFSSRTVRMHYSIPEYVRLASDPIKGPLRMIEKVEYPRRKGRIAQAKVRIEYAPLIPWEKTGEFRLEYGGISSDRTKVRYAPLDGNCLWEFIALTTVPTENFAVQVLRFGQKWGC